MDTAEIARFLESYGEALSTGDLAAIARCWAVPALVLADQGAVAVGQASEVEQFFSQATAWYQSQGLKSTRPELERAEMLSARLAAVDVRWRAFDAAGQERAQEHSHYILQLAPDGTIQVRVALTRPV